MESADPRRNYFTIGHSDYGRYVDAISWCPEKPMKAKFCRDCRHRQVAGWICYGSRTIRGFDPVKGRIIYSDPRMCENMRRDTAGPCGPEGKLFARRHTLWQLIRYRFLPEVGP